MYYMRTMEKLLLIVGVSSLPFLFTLNGDFVFDDSEAILKNKDVISESMSDAFGNDFWGTNIKSNLSHKSYRPLTILSFRLNYFMSNRSLSPFHFKVTNLICHIISCVLLWKVFQCIVNDKAQWEEDRRTIKQDLKQCRKSLKWWADIPYLSTLLFATHPIHVEAVSGIVGRADILAAITFFLAFLSYSKSVNKNQFSFIFLIGTVIMAAISMLCKENGITVLGFCMVYEITSKSNLKGNSIKTKKLSCKVPIRHVGIDSIIRMTVLTLAAVGLLYVRWHVMGRMKPEFKPTDNPTAFSESLFTKITTYSYIYFLNGLLLIWPKWLCYDWSMGCVQLIEKITNPRILLVLLMYTYGILLLYTIYKGKKRKMNRILIIAVSLVLIPFLPATNIFYPVGFVIAERILYISSAGYCLLIVIGFNRLLYRKSVTACKFGATMFLLVLLVYIARSWQRSRDWQNEYDLFIRALPVCPLNAKVHYNVAKVVDAKQNTDWAISEYREAIRLLPEYYQAMNNLANILKDQKKLAEAEKFLRAAVAVKRDFPAAWMNLGIVFANTGRIAEAESAYKTALSYRSRYPDCYYNMGLLYLQANRTEDALHSWFQAITQRPKHMLAWTNLLALLDNTEQTDRALEVIPTALAELPDAPTVNFAIGNMFGKMNRYPEAEEHFKKVIVLMGKDVQPMHYANLGVLYHRWKKIDLAKEMYKKALEVDPTFKTAQNNLESIEKHNK